MVDIRVEVESSWQVRDGSLNDCIHVRCSDDDEAQEEAQEEAQDAATFNSIASPLILVRPEDSRPCEITVKFQGNLYSVQSLSILSTARTCEIYSQNDFMCDAEYVSTLRAHVHKSGDDISNVDAHPEKILMGTVALSQDHLEINDRPDPSPAIKPHIFVGLYFKGTIEVPNPVPSASLKLRLLSLSDKTCVNLAELVIRAMAGPVLPSTMNSSDGPHQQNYDGSFGSSLLAMLIPGMLKAVRGLPDAHDLQNGAKFEHKQFASKRDCDPLQQFTSQVMSTMGQSIRKSQTNVLEDTPFLQQNSSSCIEVPNMGDLEITEGAHTKTLESNHNAVIPSIDDNTHCLNPASSFEKRFHEDDMRGVATTHDHDHSMCYRERNEIFSAVPKTDASYSGCGPEVEAALDGLKTAIFTRLDRLETICQRMETYLHFAFHSFDARFQALEARDRRLSPGDSSPSALPLICAQATGGPSSKQQETEVIDEIVECSTGSNMSDKLDSRSLDTLHSSNHLVRPICSAFQISSTSSTCSLNNIPQLHSSSSSQSLGTTCPGAAVSDVFSIDKSVEEELPEMEAASYHSSSVNLSADVLEHKEAVAVERQLSSGSNLQAIKQPKTPSLDEALLAALSAFSAPTQSACGQGSANESFEFSRESDQYEKFACDEFDTGYADNIRRSDPATSESPLAAGQTTKLQSQLMCPDFPVDVESENLEIVEPEDVSERKISPETVSAGSVLSAERANVGEEDTDAGTNTGLSSVPADGLNGTAPRAEFNLETSEECDLHEKQLSDGTMQKYEILNLECDTDKKSEGMLDDLISWDDQTSIDFSGNSAVTLKEVRFDYLDYGDNTEGVVEEIDFLTCEFPVPSIMQNEVASAGSQLELTATLTDPVKGRGTGEDATDMAVSVSTLEPLSTVNETDDATSDMLENFFLCEATGSRDIEEGATPSDQEGSFLSLADTTGFSGDNHIVFRPEDHGEVGHGVSKSLTSLSTAIGTEYILR